MATKKQKQIMMAMYPVKSLDITTYMVDNKVNVPLDIFSYLKNNRLIATPLMLIQMNTF